LTALLSGAPTVHNGGFCNGCVTYCDLASQLFMKKYESNKIYNAFFMFKKYWFYYKRKAFKRKNPFCDAQSLQNPTLSSSAAYQ
jgi:hypothetical protein